MHLCKTYIWIIPVVNRSTFLCLSVITLPVLILTYFWVPETHHWFVQLQQTKMNKSLRAVVDRSTAYKPKVIKVEPVIGHHRGSDLESPAPPGKDASNNIISSHSPDKPRLASNKVYPEPTGGGGAGESASVTVSTSVTNLLSYNNETKMGAELDTNTDTGIQPPVWQPVL